MTINPWRITLVTNPDKCNLACPLCFLRQKDSSFGMGEMDFKIAEPILREYASRGLKEVIPSTMGEPLLYTYFEKLCDLCAELNLRLNVTTNGTFPAGGVDYWSHRLLPISRDIKISLMGFKPETQSYLMPGIAPDQHRRNLSRLVQVRDELKSKNARTSSVSLQVTVCRKNQTEIQDILDYAASTGVDRVKLNRAIFLDGCSSLLRTELALPDEAFFTGITSIPIEGTYVNQIPKLLEKKVCPFIGQELWVLPDGTFQPCPNPQIRFVEGTWNQKSCQKCPIYG